MNNEYTVYIKEPEEVNLSQLFLELQMVQWETFNKDDKFYTHSCNWTDYFTVGINHERKTVYLYRPETLNK